MADSQSQAGDGNTPKAAKDKNCPFCGQAFTSSSLGRHLDLYIRPNKPKPQDGIHIVEEIQKMRGSITRRQPRASIGGETVSRRNSSTPAGTPTAAPRKQRSRDTNGYKSPAIPKDGQYAVDSTLSNFPYSRRWEATGVMNDLPGDDDATPDTTKRPVPTRNVSRQVAQKAQLDVKHKLADAMDTARAAELALRELLSSWRAAKQHIDNSSVPFKFDPLELDFPQLTLQCLKPPPTLFSSTQHPTSTSWSVQSPGQREFEALKAFFADEFADWKIKCHSATTAALEELTYPPSTPTVHDPMEAIRRAEKKAEDLEKQVSEHLESAYASWEAHSVSRRHELWVLELARGVGRKQKEVEAMKEQQHKLQQENANLKMQVDQLNRLQQPKEFKMLPPATIPFERDLVAFAYEQGVKGAKSVGFDMEDRHLDLPSLVTRCIDRWKNVIVSTRATTGLSAQKPLQTPSASSGATTAVPAENTLNKTSTPQIPGPQATQQPPAPKRQSTASTTGAASEQTSTASTTGPPSIEETSDQDADAEMEDDDSFAMMNTSPSKPLPQAPLQHASLDIPRTRGHMQQQQHHQPQQQQQHQAAAHDPRFLMQNGGSPVNTRAMSMSRSMPSMPMTLAGSALHTNEMAMAMQSVHGDAMYME